MGDRLEAWDRSETSANAAEEVPGPRAYARRWVFLLAVSLLSCSNAMVPGAGTGAAGGAGSFQQPQGQFVFASSRNRPFF